ncbi:MAG: FtsQ-type POTRA domain-containing protein [Candidatus Acidiferrales bacterium]
MEPEAYQPEVLADEEPKYLRRQKPMEIRRKTFSKHTWPFLRRVFLSSVAAVSTGFVLYEVVHFLATSPQVLLTHPEQIEVTGNRFVSRDAVAAAFRGDRGRSVVRIPMDARRQAIEQIPWVEQASVERVLPNRIRVELTERRPIAFLRNGAELMLVDAQGVILERPAEEVFAFPVVTGLSDALPQDERKRRMQVYDEFMRDLESVRAGAGNRVSEVDLADPKDLRAVMTGLGNGDSNAVVVHFGDGNFTVKYRMLAENFSEWQAKTGRVESVDLRYQRQIVVNPETPAPATAKAEAAPATTPVQPRTHAQAPVRKAAKHEARPARKDSRKH